MDRPDVSGLRALFVNCTLTPSPGRSHTAGLMAVSTAIMAANGVDVDEGSGGPRNDFTQRNTTFMTWNLLHPAAMPRAAGGIPGHRNDRTAWAAGARFGHPNPEYR